MNSVITQFANAEAAQKADLFSSLGIDWTLLVLLTIAFLVLLVILRKWVYPPLVAMLDRREKALKQSSEAAQVAKTEAENAEKKTAELLKQARSEAGDIVTTAREEAANIVDEAQSKAVDKAKALVESAHDDIAKEIESARKMLYNETLELVAEATGKVLGEKIDAKKDTKLISEALEEAE